MKIIPIQGLYIKEPLICPVRAYKLSDFTEVSDEKEQDKVYVDNFVFVNRGNLSIVVKNEIEVRNALTKFKDIETFAVISIRPNKLTEFYDLRVALSIIYIAFRMKVERRTEFFQQINLRYAYFDEDYITSTRWDVKIGTKSIDENDFDATIPVYYTTDDEPESWRNVIYDTKILRIDMCISDEIKKLYYGIIKRNEMSIKLRYVFNLLYSTLQFNNLDLVIPTYATILETLLLGENEDNQRKKVSVRSACLIKDGDCYKAKEYIANWVFYFYKYRNAIVHDGKNYLELSSEEIVVFDHAISLIQHLIFNIIKIIVNKNITCIKDIIEYVTDNGKTDCLENNFDYISENMTMYYEE